jgi:hypothetical protein
MDLSLMDIRWISITLCSGTDGLSMKKEKHVNWQVPNERKKNQA